jgi:DNA-binding PadR family transcriptional regulator
MVKTAAGMAPDAPKSLEETGLEPTAIHELALKLSSTVPHLTTNWAAAAMRVPPALIEKAFWQLKQDKFIEILGQVNELEYRYAITDRGREYAQRLMEICGYIGPAPVSLAAYTAMLEWQVATRPKPQFDRICDTISSIVLSREAVEVAALAASSGRSLFLFGPAGNGKTSLGMLLNKVFDGEIWIPHAIAVAHNVIRLFDPHVHKVIETSDDPFVPTDHRWIKIRPPFVVAGGEMTMAELDLAYSPALRYYEAPPHVKANGGTFLIDDFGRQRIEPHELLNRWIVPLEHQIDHLTLATGQKIDIPFKLMLIVATNLSLQVVADPAFLRRMGYRLHVQTPTPQVYTEIFMRYAKGAGLGVPDGMIGRLLARYAAEGRDLRGSEPRDLIERCRDICRLRRKPFTLDAEVLDMAWFAYFGQTPADAAPTASSR